MTTAITSDNTLGSQISSTGNVHNITGGTRPGDGPNLFHSFGQFNVAKGEIANFLNDSGLNTSNILGRITEGEPSYIMGTIKTIDVTQGFGDANLYLMNPQGIIFGPNANLNIGGSFYATTANKIEFTDNIQFSAVPGLDDVAILTSAPPKAFGFLAENPADITINQSSLNVPEGKSLSLIGGDIRILGNLDQGANETTPSLKTKGGRINLISVASKGAVVLNTLDKPSDIAISVNSFEQLGEITISGNASVDTSGNGGGTVVIRAGRLMIDKSKIYANTIGAAKDGPAPSQLGKGIDIQVAGELLIDNRSGLETNLESDLPEGTAAGGGVRVMADHLEIRNDSYVESSVFSGSTRGKSGNIDLEANSIRIQGGDSENGTVRAHTNGSADSGDIIITANRNLEVRDGAQILTFALAESGNAGDIEISGGNILLSGTPETLTGISSQTNPLDTDASIKGNSGNIRMTVNRLEMLETFISTVSLSDGNPGNVEIDAEQGDVFISGSHEPNAPFFGIFANTFASRPGGNLNITAKNLKLTKQASLQASTNNTGNAGNITLTLTGVLDVEDNSFIQVASLSPDTSAGDAGDLILTAKNIEIRGQTNDSSATGLSAATRAGKGGSITIFTDSLLVTDRGFITSRALASGNGGSINAKVQNLTLNNDSAITAGSISSGNAGSVKLNVNDLTSNGNAEVSSSSNSQEPDAGGGGTIDVTASNSLNLTDTTISTSVAGGSKPGGNITLKADRVVGLNDETTVTAQSSGAGNAGNINIEARETIQIDNSSVTTQAALASGGDIKLDADNMIRLTNSTIESSVQGNQTTTGGGISLDPQFVILQNSRILATATSGFGGNIEIVGDLVLADPFSLNPENLSATSIAGPQFSGNVDIRAPIQNLSESIAPLPEALIKIAALFAARCAAQKGGNFSSFVPGGFGGAPPGFSGLLPSPLTFFHSTSDGSTTIVSRIGFDDNQEDTEWKLFNISQATEFSHDCSTAFVSPS
ncbi:MAG: hypothetical protein NPIRA04_12720 [Nitrospirales bacterium]|nr:MAG: hypothetical protein NPIRA04_12720 [Nitrospirales bacterium]